jgi:CheY-like chemotaxis protein
MAYALDQISGSASQSLPGILVVDDDSDVLTVLNSMLGVSGFRVWPCANGQKAFDLYRQHHADIAAVLLDVRMPGWDGVQTLSAIRVLNPAVRFCFMTGDPGCYAQEELAALGSAVVLKKPFDFEEVFRVLGELTRGTRGVPA